MRKIVLIATGGTIASTATGAGKVANVNAAELAESLGDALPADIQLVARDAGRINSYNLTLADTRKIAEAVSATVAEPEVTGVVVTHGTDTLEESSFLCDLVNSGSKPVVFTGAQQSPDAIGSDGPTNMAEAISVAASSDSVGRGALVSFARDIFAARGVRKTYTFAPQPFAAVIGGPIGFSHAGAAWYTARPEPWRRLAAPSRNFDQIRIATVLNTPGFPGDEQIRQALANDFDGILVEGTGAGNTNHQLVSGIREATAAGVPVLLATRVPFGHIRAVYGNGGAVDAVAAGAVPLWSIPVSQARLLLAALIDQFGPEEGVEIAKDFDTRQGWWQPQTTTE